MVTEFRWSSLIVDGFNRNQKLFAPNGLSAGTPTKPYPIIPGLLALHIRRGDFEQHCRGLAEWGSTWTGFNQLPDLPDHFDPPPGAKEGNTTQAIYDAYAKSCYPSIEQVVQKVLEIKQTKAGNDLSNIYIMTNGKRPWLSSLKNALHRSGNWNQISSSRELEITWEQKFVAQSIDMAVGQRANVFIGNGVSQTPLALESAAFVDFDTTVLEFDCHDCHAPNGKRSGPCGDKALVLATLFSTTNQSHSDFLSHHHRPRQEPVGPASVTRRRKTIRSLIHKCHK